MTNPETQASFLFENILQRMDLDSAIIVLSRAFEMSCNRLLNEFKYGESKTLVRSARDYARNVRQLFQLAWEKAKAKSVA